MRQRRGSLAVCALLVAAGLAATIDAQQPVDQKASPPPPSQCVVCHEKQDGLLQRAVTDWRSSVHAEKGIGCEGCHKGDPDDAKFAHDAGRGFVAAPRLREIPYFCGRCHSEIKEKHLGSPHGEQGLPNCVTCHGSHAVLPVDPSRIISEEACSKCHRYEPAGRALDSLRKAHTLLGEISTLVESVEHIPAVQEHLARLAADLHVDRPGVIAALHSFRIAEMDRVGMNADRLKKLARKLEERENQRATNIARERPITLLLMVFFLLASCFGYLVYHGKGEVEPGK
jgi:hypothetical protein